MEVELGLACGDQLAQRAADAAGAAESVQRQPGGHEKAADARHWTDERTRIRGHGVGVADELHNARLAQVRKAPGRAREQWLETRLVRRQ